jgi:hypothetical protein
MPHIDWAMRRSQKASEEQVNRRLGFEGARLQPRRYFYTTSGTAEVVAEKPWASEF